MQPETRTILRHTLASMHGLHVLVLGLPGGYIVIPNTKVYKQYPSNPKVPTTIWLHLRNTGTLKDFNGTCGVPGPQKYVK